MTKLRALIVDDEPLAQEVIINYAQDVSFLEIVGQCYLATEALSFLSSQPVDLIFLDIQMPKLKGLDFLRTLHKKPIVIITSAYETYALESFELDVCDYLLKPFRIERFFKAVNKALEVYQLKYHIPPSALTTLETTPPVPQQLFIKSDKRFIQIDIADIYYLESYGNYVKVWLQDEYHLTPRTLSDFEMELPANDFIRIHKSFLINRKYIDYMEGNTLVMKNKATLPIGKNYRTDVKRFIM
ncbi:MAG: LytTR family DNA-binding domain-containing protein [Saprospiraceae bacterium]|nr:LytTR family DNA-binding domain-containing protein [Saprospiraceae bacterium]